MNINDDDVPADFPQLEQDPVANYLRWQECDLASLHVANMCVDAKADAAPGSTQELLERAVSLVCGQNFTDKETRWVVRCSAIQLGW